MKNIFFSKQSYNGAINAVLLLLVLAQLFVFCKKEEPPPPPDKKECVIKVIDWPKESDDALDELAKKHPDALKVYGKDEMVKKILEKMEQDKCDCISKLYVMGHGAEGNISVGAGKKSLECKEIDGHKEEWEEALKPLKGKFCKDAEIVLFGCSVGAGEKGANKLKEIADFFGVKVKAPTTPVYPSDDPDAKSDQEATPEKKPEAKTAEDIGGDLRKKTGVSVALIPPDFIKGLSVLTCDRDYWEKPLDIDYFIQDKNLIGGIWNGIIQNVEYETAGMPSKYDAAIHGIAQGEPFVLYVYLNWKAVELQNGTQRSAFLLMPHASEMLRELAR